MFYPNIKSPKCIDKLREFIHEGETAVFTGMSGVGKNTLINALCGQQVLSVTLPEKAIILPPAVRWYCYQVGSAD